MVKLTPTQLDEKLKTADKISPAGFSNSKTRHGSYIYIVKGLTGSTIFTGMDLENNSYVIEIVG